MVSGDSWSETPNRPLADAPRPDNTKPPRTKIILDLCGGSGAWSQPYKEAGYDVRVVTLPDYDLFTYQPPSNVYGILAAPTCTQFSLARTTAKTPRDLRGGMALVKRCLEIIWEARFAGTLHFWALENPMGYGVALDAAAKGMGLAGKPEGMSGAKAPVMWAEGRREDVLNYVAQDVRTTLELASECEALGVLRWVARSGKVRCMNLGEGWLTVDRALELPVPDTSWMSEPWKQATFTGWMG